MLFLALEDVKAVLDIAKERHYPSCDAIDRGLKAVEHCEQVARTARGMLKRKVHTRFVVHFKA